MKKLLHIIASPRKDASHSEKIADAFKSEYIRLNPSAEIDVLDLWENPIPTYDAYKVAARMTFAGEGKLEGDLVKAWAEVTEVTGRFKSADDYLFSVPMWNSGIPWILKQYIDTVTEPGLTFGFSKDTGFVPLLKDKKAFIVYTTGIYNPSLPAAFGLDFQSAYMTWWLNSIGVNQIFPVHYFSNIIAADKEEQKIIAMGAAVQIASDHFSGQ